MDKRVRKMVVEDLMIHKYDEILCPVYHRGHPASHHSSPVGEGHGEGSPKIQESYTNPEPGIQSGPGGSVDAD